MTQRRAIVLRDVEFDPDPAQPRLPRPSFALYMRMCREDKRYRGGIVRMVAQKLGDGMTNAASASLVTSLAAWNPALGVGVYAVVTAVETFVAVGTFAGQAHELDEAQAIRLHGLEMPVARQQAHGRSLARSGAIDAACAALVSAGLIVASRVEPRHGVWIVFTALTAYKLIQSNNSMAELGQWRCLMHASPVERTRKMLEHHRNYVGAVEMGLTTSLYAVVTLCLFIALEALRSESDRGFEWLAPALALAGGLLSAGAKSSFGTVPIEQPDTAAGLPPSIA